MCLYGQQQTLNTPFSNLIRNIILKIIISYLTLIWMQFREQIAAVNFKRSTLFNEWGMWISIKWYTYLLIDILWYLTKIKYKGLIYTTIVNPGLLSSISLLQSLILLQCTHKSLKHQKCFNNLIFLVCLHMSSKRAK